MEARPAARGPARLTGGDAALKPVDQPVEIVAFDLRADLLAKAALDFVQDVTGALDIAFFRNADGAIGALPTGFPLWTAERIGAALAIAAWSKRDPWQTLARTWALAWPLRLSFAALALTFSQLLHHVLRALTKSFQGAPLVAECGGRIALTEPLAGAFHGIARFAKLLRIKSKITQLVHQGT